MGADFFQTGGLGKIQRYQDRVTTQLDGDLYEVLMICPSATLPSGATNSNGVGVGADDTIALWLNPGDAVKFMTRKMSALVFQDVNAAASYLSIFFWEPEHFVIPER